VAMKRAIRAVELMHLLSQLKDPQSELLLLRYIMHGYFQTFFWSKDMPTDLHRIGSHFV
jgi:hypothetical protein